jgi:hypothetical protein
MMVKGGPLSEILFVPEPFRAADKAAIEQRRTAALVPALPPKSGPRKLMILVGEVKDFAPTRSGHRLIVKHMPDFRSCWTKACIASPGSLRERAGAVGRGRGFSPDGDRDVRADAGRPCGR